MQIVQYPHPTLRHKSKPIRRVDAQIRAVVAEMFELMYEAKGVGLAANQVDLPYRIFIANPSAEPSSEDEMVFINPVLSSPKGTAEGEEGCLSLPGVYAPVKRPKTIVCTSYNLQGEETTLELSGLLSRVVQHENDHLDGVLFIDRLSETAEIEVQDDIATFEMSFEGMQGRGEIPSDDVIAQRLAEIEAKYC